MISFVIPAHNEELLFGPTLAALREAAKTLGEPYEIVVADNSSSDRTAAVVMWSEAYPFQYPYHEEKIYAQHLGTIVPTAVSQPPAGGLALEPPVPNPFHGASLITYALPTADAIREGTAAFRVRLLIFGIDGRLVRTLVDASLSTGTHRIGWDARDGEGRRVSPGICLLRLGEGEQQLERRLVVLD